MDDLRLEQVDAVLHRHVLQIAGSNLAQFQPGVIDRVQLLLLQDLRRDIPHSDNEERRRRVMLFPVRGRLHIEKRLLSQPQRAANRPVGGNGRLKRTDVRSAQRPKPERLAERPPATAHLAARQLIEPTVAPENSLMGVHHRHAIGQMSHQPRRLRNEAGGPQRIDRRLQDENPAHIRLVEMLQRIGKDRGADGDIHLRQCL